MTMCSKVDISTTEVVKKEKEGKSSKNHIYEYDLGVKYMGMDLSARTTPRSAFSIPLRKCGLVFSDRNHPQSAVQMS